MSTAGASFMVWWFWWLINFTESLQASVPVGCVVCFSAVVDVLERFLSGWGLSWRAYGNQDSLCPMQNCCCPKQLELWLTNFHVSLWLFKELLLAVLAGFAEGCAHLAWRWWWQLASVRVLGTGDQLGGCIAVPSAAGEDGQMGNLESWGCSTWWGAEGICLVWGSSWSWRCQVTSATRAEGWALGMAAQLQPCAHGHLVQGGDGCSALLPPPRVSRAFLSCCPLSPVCDCAREEPAQVSRPPWGTALRKRDCRGMDH